MSERMSLGAAGQRLAALARAAFPDAPGEPESGEPES
jgi:hypothetical protein